MEIKYVHLEEEHNKRAASIVLPQVLKFLNPVSIVDVGCGIGTWLAVAKDLGINDLLGIDGNYVDRSLLLKFLENDKFLSKDLNQSFVLDRNFNLCICLEVAEHLPESSAHHLINSLAGLSPVILFSAAVPNQGGQNHLNEQWPEYWAEKFSKHEYVFLDIIRPLIWNNPKVEFWYRQNIFLVVKSNHELAKKYAHSHLSFVHPELFLSKITQYEKRISSLQSQLAVHPLKRWIKSLIS